MKESYEQVILPLPELDDDGFMLKPEKWTQDVAESLAGVPLSPEQWKVVEYLRAYYAEFEYIPPVPMLCRDTGFNMKALYELFPQGLRAGACRIAGIPRWRIHPLYP